MIRFDQSPTDPTFVQAPYPTYARMRAAGDLVFWQDYGMPCAVSHAAVHALLRDRRFGREVPVEMAPEVPAHLAAFYDVEAHSMLELEPPRHTRLRGLVLRAFTSRKLGTMRNDIDALCNRLIDDFPTGDFDLLTSFAQKLPVIVIARLLGVPEAMSDQLLLWSNAMVAMYQARRDRTVEDAAARAAAEFSAYLGSYIDARRSAPRDDLITHLIAAEEDGEKLSPQELIATCILVLNAGHEATVHTIGNGLNTILPMGLRVTPENAEAVTEEILRFDPPLHMFTRYAYEEAEVFGHRFQRGDQVGLMLASANRDDQVWPDAERFDARRTPSIHSSFGGGLHFCVGAPLARLEMQVALPALFSRCPGLRRVAPGTYADSYHFHGLDRLMVAV